MKIRPLLLTGCALGVAMAGLPAGATAAEVLVVTAEDPTARELSPFVDAFDSIRFRIFRSGGDLSLETLVFFSVRGSAASGEDYQKLDSPVKIPTGESSVTVEVLTIDDDKAENIETIYLRLEPSPMLGPAPAYEIDPANDDAVAVILDNDGPLRAAVEIVSPAEGDTFTLPSGIEVIAAAYHAERDVIDVDFYADEERIGHSQIIFDKPFSGGLIVHRLLWHPTSGGTRALTARGYDENHTLVATSPPVNVTLQGEPPPAGVVGIEATRNIAEEDSAPLERLPLVGEFTISRTGPTAHAQPVYVRYSGSAAPEHDCPGLPAMVTIPAGAASTTIRVQPNADGIPEGIETLTAAVSGCPGDDTLIPCFGFEVDPAHASATVFLRDDGVMRASVEITSPNDGAGFRPDDPIVIEATAVDLDGYVSRVEFWSDDQRIGESQINFIRAPDPGTPIGHHFEWQNAPAGTHALTARAVSASGAALRSHPVNITVGEQPPPLVRIDATANIAEESSMPLRRMNLVGIFTISRTGPTHSLLPVFLKYSGMAVPGHDYPVLPWMITIPAGASSLELRVEAINDAVPEGLETLIASISQDPPPEAAAMNLPHSDFEVDPGHASATIFLRDDGLTETSVVITRPLDGAIFHAGETIRVEATAIDLHGFIGRVQYWDGENLIGSSEVVFIQPPPDGSPVSHYFDWSGAAAGGHVLSARVLRTDGSVLTSPPVRITVGASGQSPTAAIASPVNGQEFEPETDIEILATARDPDGYVPKLEFFADGRRIAAAGIEFMQPPPPGQSQTFSFVWRQASPGPHVLIVRATDNSGNVGESGGIEIRVGEPALLPVVVVSATDPFAVEPSQDSAADTTTFRIRRFGSSSEALEVSYVLSGGAANGADYERLSGVATIPAGERSVSVTVRPLADDAAEGSETVFLRIQHRSDPLALLLPTYQIGSQSHAAALIADVWDRLPDGAKCATVGDSLLHVCFGGLSDSIFRVEVSPDLRNWETAATAASADGTVHFLDDMSAIRQRFYRIAPEPVPETDP